MDKFMTEILGKPLTNNRMLLSFFLLRLSSVFFVQTYYVADEYWQSLEVAHHQVFGFGYLTWEWRESAIRSSVYPSIFAVLFHILRVLGLDNRNVVIVFPRIVQAIITAFGDLYTVKLSQRIYNQENETGVGPWTFWTILTSWFMFYCGSRTIVNTLETALTAITLYHFPWTGSRSESKRSLLWFACFASITVIIRPTSAILFAPLAFVVLKKIFGTFVYVGLMTLSISAICDRVFYKRWVFTLWNFFEFNVLSGSSGFYGTHFWHWYFTQGFPVIMTTHLLPFYLYIINRLKMWPVLLVFWQLFVYSWIPHKEFRFIMPVLPLAFCVVGKYLAAIEKRTRSFNAGDLFLIMLTTNLCLSVFFGTFWNVGPLQAADQVAKELETKFTSSSADRPSVLYLMPCHSLPLYSHLHVNVKTRFLTCEPNLKRVDSYVDEASRFYQDKDLFIRNEIPELATYDLIVIYQSLEDDLKVFFKANDYSRSRSVINFGEFDERRGNSIIIYSNYRKLYS